MNTKTIKQSRVTFILARFWRGGKHWAAGALLAVATGSTSPAFAMGDGLSPGLFPLPAGVNNRLLLACDTDEADQLNGCNAEGVEYLALPADAGEVFWNNGKTIEPGVVVSGMQEVGIVGKQNTATSFDEVCISVDVRTGPPADRGKLVCVEILPETACANGGCSSSACNAAVPVVSDQNFCSSVEAQLEQGYTINGLGYVVDIDFPRIGESGRTTIRKCTGFAHRCTPIREAVVVKGSRHTGGYHTPGYGGRYYLR